MEILVLHIIYWYTHTHRSAETENYGFETILTVRKSHLRTKPPRDGEDQEENQKSPLRIFRPHFEALCGSREGPTGIFTAVVPHTSLHWITGAGEP